MFYYSYVISSFFAISSRVISLNFGERKPIYPNLPSKAGLFVPNKTLHHYPTITHHNGPSNQALGWVGTCVWNRCVCGVDGVFVSHQTISDWSQLRQDCLPSSSNVGLMQHWTLNPSLWSLNTQDVYTMVTTQDNGCIKL